MSFEAGQYDNNEHTKREVKRSMLKRVDDLAGRVDVDGSVSDEIVVEELFQDNISLACQV